MGVVHKLTKEVIDFIINYKKENAQVSCRQLATLASEQFQINVSKSSVNTLLKNSQLSNPVGRPDQVNNKVFKIPLERKQQIFPQTYSNTTSIEKSENMIIDPPTSEVVMPQEKVKNIKKEISIKKPKIELVKSKKDVEEKSLPLIKDPIEENGNLVQTPKELASDTKETSFDESTLKNIYQIRRELIESKQNLVSQSGTVLFKNIFAHYLQIFNLKGLIGKYFSQPLPTDFDFLCENIFYYKLAQLVGADLNRDIIAEQIDTQPRIKWLEEISLPSVFGLEYALQKKQALKNVSYFKVILRDKTQFIIDAQGQFLWNDAPRLYRPQVLERAIDLLSKTIIGNSQPIILNLSQTIFELSEKLSDFIYCCQGGDDKAIEKICVYGEEDKPIIIFDTIPKRRREFLIGLSSRQKEFSLITKNIKWVKKQAHYHKQTDQLFFISQIQTDYLKNDSKSSNWLRAVTLSNENKEPIFCILTNNQTDNVDLIVDKYLNRWPDLNNTSAFMLHRKKIVLDEKEKLSLVPTIKLKEILQDYVESAIYFIKQYYLPNNSTDFEKLVSTFINIQAARFFMEQRTLLSLENKDYEHWDELVFFIQRINESNYFAEFKEKFFVKMV